MLNCFRNQHALQHVACRYAKEIKVVMLGLAVPPERIVYYMHGHSDT